MQIKKRIFLCHSSADKVFVRKLAEDLRANGVNIWLDELEIKVGDSLRQKIEEGILSSAWLAVILSRNSIKSQWVNRELSAAFARELELNRVFILPLLIDECAIPVFLRDKLYADFRSDYQSGLQAILKAVDSNTSDFQGSWWGRWNWPVSSPFAGGQLFIQEINSDGFRFSLSVFSGAHIGEISGKARLSDDNQAVFLEEWEGETCKLEFVMQFHDRPQIAIEEVSGCLGFHGVAVNFDGTYIKEREILYELGILDEKDLASLYQIQGEYYWKFRDIFYQISEENNEDGFQAQVHIGGAPGLYTIVEAIIMKGELGELWAAFIDTDDDVVRYFTTESEFKNKLPRTIETWRERFSEKDVVYNSPLVRDAE